MPVVVYFDVGSYVFGESVWGGSVAVVCYGVHVVSLLENVLVYDDSPSLTVFEVVSLGESEE